MDTDSHTPQASDQTPSQALAPELMDSARWMGRMRHPNFDAGQTPIAPDRTLMEVPEPSRRVCQVSQSLYDATALVAPNYECWSPWALVQSPELMEHIAFMQAAGLMALPADFLAERIDAAKADKYPLLAPLTEMRWLDLEDIATVRRQLPSLTRYGWAETTGNGVGAETDVVKSNVQSNVKNQLKNDLKKHLSHKATITTPEIISDDYACDWQLILHPEHYDNGVDSLSTDLLACSVAVHVLKQCDPRKTINSTLSVTDICHYLRSYVLSQCRLAPQYASHYRQIRLFAGHVLFAAAHLGYQMQGEHLALSSRNALFMRYPNFVALRTVAWVDP